MQIIKFGTPIVTVIGNVKAIITATCIRDQNITYEISYFHNGMSVQTWLHRIEFKIDESDKQKPGLVNYDKQQEETFLMLS